LLLVIASRVIFAIAVSATFGSAHRWLTQQPPGFIAPP
jgi:hypothetical protein